MNSGNETSQMELDWLANRYVTRELSTDETAAFEEQLASDEAACDAVARAMTLNLAVVAAFDTPTFDTPTFAATVVVAQPSVVVPSRLAASVITALAATAIAAAGVALMVETGNPTRNGLAHKEGADRIVAAWVHGEAARNNFDDDDMLDSNDDSDLDPPDWMLAALTVEPNDDDEIRDN